MKKLGYSDALATGSIAAGGTLGILIPPSTLMVIYGIMTETSIGKLFIAGIVPGAIATALLCLAVTATPKGSTYVLAGGKTSRLYKTLVYERRIATDVSAYQHSREMSGLFQVACTAAAGVEVFAMAPHALEALPVDIALMSIRDQRKPLLTGLSPSTRKRLPAFVGRRVLGLAIGIRATISGVREHLVDGAIKRAFPESLSARGHSRQLQTMLLEPQQGLEVEMVGRLVQHQEVRRVVEHLGHDETGLLAARQHAARLLDIVAGEAEAARERLQRARPRLREGRVERFEHRLLAVQQIHRVLREVAHADRKSTRLNSSHT